MKKCQKNINGKKFIYYIADEIIKKHFLNEEEFYLKYPLSSAAKTEPSFNPHDSRFLWRGPTWPVINWFMHKCFLSCGYEKQARHLVHSVKELIDKSGFREYYNPENGKGYGAKDFTWSGLIVDMMEK